MGFIITARNSLLALGCVYAIFLSLLIHPTVQREVFYLNSLRFPWFVNTSIPENFGFSALRASSIFIGELHAWHIAPLPNNVLRDPHEAQIDTSDIRRLVIYFHGTAGTLAVPHRLTTYRILSAIPNTHVLAFDYRGFGKSKGVPTEDGLIQDGISIVEWALLNGFRAQDITLFGQSLGSAVAFGAAHALATRPVRPIELGHVVSVAGIYSAREVIKTYRIGGIIPILGPLRTYPWIQRQLLDRLQHHWDSSSRIYDLSRLTKTKITLAHASNDNEVLCENSEQLFLQAVKGAYAGHENVQLDNLIDRTILANNGKSMQTLLDDRILYRELVWGAHNLVQWNDEIILRL